MHKLMVRPRREVVLWGVTSVRSRLQMSDHWGRLLAMAECSYNAHVHKATSMPRSRPTLRSTYESPLAPRQGPGGEAIAGGFATKVNISQQLTDAFGLSQAAMADTRA